jgi:cob(I)alamin adenosyltransferase
MSGMIHLYTGNGKGKTTAALGLALRAAGAGRKIFIAQFVKGMHYSEITALKRFPEIELRQFGLDCFIVNEPTQKDIDAAKSGLAETEMAMASSEYDMYILDEVCIALHYNLFSVEELKKALLSKPENAELVLTGRYAPDKLYEMADLITEMNEVKHYYNDGIQARKGIEF